MAEQEALRLRGVGLRAPDGTVLLQDISWRLAEGEAGVIVGPSGSGKSLLLRLINRLSEPTSGTVEVLGRPQSEWDVRALRRAALLVSQRPALPEATARANLELPVRLGLLTSALLCERLGEALGLAGVPEALLDRPSGLLSGGERARLAIARALVLQPRLLLLDEPTSALDPPTAAALLQSLHAWLARTSTTLVMVTHRLAEARVLRGQGLVLAAGRVVEQGELQAVLGSPRTAEAQAFLGLAASGSSP